MNLEGLKQFKKLDSSELKQVNGGDWITKKEYCRTLRNSIHHHGEFHSGEREAFTDALVAHCL